MGIRNTSPDTCKEQAEEVRGEVVKFVNREAFYWIPSIVRGLVINYGDGELQNAKIVGIKV